MNTKGTIIFVVMFAPWGYLFIALWDIAPLLGVPIIVLSAIYRSFVFKKGPILSGRPGAKFWEAGKTKTINKSVNVITVISVLKQTRCTNVSNWFYFGMTLYMFRTVFPSIIRSSRLYIQKQAFVKQILLSACWQGDSSICLVVVCTVLNSRSSRQQYLFDVWLLLYVHSSTPDYGR